MCRDAALTNSGGGGAIEENEASPPSMTSSLTHRIERSGHSGLGDQGRLRKSCERPGASSSNDSTGEASPPATRAAALGYPRRPAPGPPSAAWPPASLHSSECATSHERRAVVFQTKKKRVSKLRACLRGEWLEAVSREVPHGIFVFVTVRSGGSGTSPVRSASSLACAGLWLARRIVDYGNYYYKYSDEYPLSSDIEEQLMAVQELIEQGAVRRRFFLCVFFAGGACPPLTMRVVARSAPSPGFGSVRTSSRLGSCRGSGPSCTPDARCGALEIDG